MLDVFSLGKLLFLNRNALCLPTFWISSVFSFHSTTYMVHPNFLTAKSSLISVTLLFMWILLPHPSFALPSHQLHQALISIHIITPIFFLGCFTTINQEKLEKHLQVTLNPPILYLCFLGERALESSLLTHADFTWWGSQAVGKHPFSRLLLANAGFFYPSWSSLQLCQNLGGKTADGAAGAGTTWGITELCKCPQVSAMHCEQHRMIELFQLENISKIIESNL